MSSPALLEVDGLNVSFRAAGGDVHVLSDVSFDVSPGEIVGLVGESGSGKSVTCMALMRLLPRRRATVSATVVRLGDADLGALSDHELEDLRGSEVGFVFQDPVASLNPSQTVGDQIAEVVRRHRHVSHREARAVAARMLGRVGIPDPVRRLRNHPHEMSGGMCQRVMIAMALACEPKLLIADEPTTALDVTVQAQIIELLRDLVSDGSMSVLLVTHDLGLVAELCQRVVVMYAGEVIERGDVLTIFQSPRHPYTKALVDAAPRIGSGTLVSIEGSVPVAGQVPPGCRFSPRCTLATDECFTTLVALEQVGDRHVARCIHHERVGA